MSFGISALVLPVTMALIAILIFSPLPHYQAYFSSPGCPANISTVSGLYPINIVYLLYLLRQFASSETFVMEDHCIEKLGLSWDFLICLYVIFLLIFLLVIGCYNCRIPSSYKQEGELAILTALISLFLVATYFSVGLALSIGRTTHSRIESYMTYASGFQWLYPSFLLTIIYLPKVSEIFYAETLINTAAHTRLLLLRG